MVDRTDTPDSRWAAVDSLVYTQLLGNDPVLDSALATNAANGLPDIDVSPAQGRMLHIFARMIGARRILEVGSLGGYSAIELGRALPPDGELVTLEIDPHHAAVARANIAQAGLDDRCRVMTGPALHSLATLSGPFDLVFIDADKENNDAYLAEAVRLSRPGTAIIVDNVVREGGILDAASDDPRIQGTRRVFESISRNPRLTATAIQTVGVKKWDGFVIALVDALW